jgi:hypothetical protein
MPRLARSTGPFLSRLTVFALIVPLLVAAVPSHAATRRRPPPAVGRWNLTVTGPDGTTFPSWLEITFDDAGKLGGRLCGRVGVPRPLARVELKKNELTFVDIESQDKANIERIYRAKIRYGMLDGAASAPEGPAWTFLGARAPKFPQRGKVPWGKPVALISKGLLGWRLRDNKKGPCWKEGAAVLSSRTPCVDIVSDGRYQDFKLHLEVKLERGASTGVYLRGRYEVAIADDAGEPASDRGTGAIHGLIAPRRNAARPAGEWQTLDVTMMGRKVTVVVNGERVIDSQEIDGPTGGAIDSEEANPGPVMLQSDRGAVAFRNVIVTPTVW